MAKDNVNEKTNSLNNHDNIDDRDLDQAFQKTEDALLLDGLNRTYTERN